MIHADILAYNQQQAETDQSISDVLARAIDVALPGAQNKLWHGAPVWFIDGNPIVGYAKLKDCVQLLFWSGQSFDEQGLQPSGSFKAAEARYKELDQVHIDDVQRWLKKSVKIQWDYKNITKRRGQLQRLV